MEERERERKGDAGLVKQLRFFALASLLVFMIPGIPHQKVLCMLPGFCLMEMVDVIVTPVFATAAFNLYSTMKGVSHSAFLIILFLWVFGCGGHSAVNTLEKYEKVYHGEGPSELLFFLHEYYTHSIQAASYCLLLFLLLLSDDTNNTNNNNKQRVVLPIDLRYLLSFFHGVAFWAITTGTRTAWFALPFCVVCLLRWGWGAKKRTFTRYILRVLALAVVGYVLWGGYWGGNLPTFEDLKDLRGH